MNKTIIFFVLVAIIIAGFFGFWYYRDQIFSKEILKLEILGPENASMGAEVEYTVKYKNNGNLVLQSPKLIFNLPDNSLTEDGKTRLMQDLKDIYPGDERFAQFKVRLMGKEGDLKVARAGLSFIPKNLSARYESNTTFTTKINVVPLTLSFDLPSKVEKGKEISYAINYFSNIDYPLENLSVKIDPAPGFDFKSANPVSLDDTEWKLATLHKAQGGRITVKGVVSADTGSHLNFLTKVGMWQDGTFVEIKEANQDVEVVNPLLFISQQINGSSNYVASPGEMLRYEIFFRNIGSSSFDNLFIVSKLDGSAFDFSSLRSGEGQARPSDNLIVWDAKQVSELQHLAPQEEGKVEFAITLKDGWTPSDSEKNNMVIKSFVNVSGISQEFDTKVNSNLALSQKAYYAPQGSIVNIGPIPPAVNQTTTYAVSWQVKNYFNDMKNVKVKALLPQGVILTANLFPESQISHFSFDSNSREIVWSVGDLAAGTGVTNDAPSLTFQIALIPNFSMQGKLADLIKSATVSGEDQATGAMVTKTVPGINTSLPDDQANSGDGLVRY